MARSQGMSITLGIVSLLAIALALSPIIQTDPVLLTTTFASRTFASPDSTSTSTHIFFTDASQNPLPLDLRGNPKVDAAIVISQVCTGYSNRGHNCVSSRNSYAVQNTTPDQLLAWINITRTSGAPLQSLRLNESLPADWAINPPLPTSLGGTRVYYANTTRLRTDPDITQSSSISLETHTSNVLRLIIQNFNATGIGHPLLAGQSILISVKLTYNWVGVAQRSVSYPKNYTDAAAIAGWTQKSYAGVESTSSASAFFAAYATYSTPVGVPPRPLLDSVLSLLPIVGVVVAIVAMTLGIVALSNRRKRSRGFPASTPQQ
jgi:hypothetical protein